MMTPIDYNFDFQIRENGAQAVVTNNLGRTALFGELVYLGGYVGYVAEPDGIANGASGRIQLLDPEVEVSTAQVEATDTFTAGNVLYFIPGGSSAAGKLVDAPADGSVPVGKITGAFGSAGAQTAVKFRPFPSSEALPGAALKVARVVIDGATDYSTIGKAANIPVGSTILDVIAVATATHSGGTAQVMNGSSAVHTAIAMATDGAVTRMSAGVDDTKLVVTDAVTVKTAALGDAGIVIILYV